MSSQEKQLQEALDSGNISREEFERQLKAVKEAPALVQKEKVEEEEPAKLKSEFMLLIILGIIIVFLVSLFALPYFFKEETPKTVDELHALNIDGKLPKEQGIVYRGVYSFIKLDDFWYTTLQSPLGQTLYDFSFRYSPKEVENVSIKGFLSKDFFNNATEYYVTFDPLGKEFSHIRLARFDFDTQMLKVFQKTPISACDRNISDDSKMCEGLPMVTCDDIDKLVVYYKEEDAARVEYTGNCIIIAGKGFDIVRGVDRILYNLYGVME